MERYFITGATGFIGKELTRKLTGMQMQVHALVRNPEKLASLNSPYLKLFKGDLYGSGIGGSRHGGVHRSIPPCRLGAFISNRPGDFRKGKRKRYR